MSSIDSPAGIAAATAAAAASNNAPGTNAQVPSSSRSKALSNPFNPSNSNGNAGGITSGGSNIIAAIMTQPTSNDNATVVPYHSGDGPVSRFDLALTA